MGNISNTPVSEAGSIFPGTPNVYVLEEEAPPRRALYQALLIKRSLEDPEALFKATEP